MTFKRFFLFCLCASLLMVLLFVAIHVRSNDYGLFGDVRGRLIPVYANERTSKYLFSYNYIPSNFEGLLLGSSLSHNLNTKEVTGFKIYNGSLSGANFTELDLIAKNVIKRGKLKFIVICLHPYTTQTHGRRSSFMNPHEYWESLGSLATLDLYRHKILVLLGKKEVISNEYGFHDRNLDKKIDSRKKISQAANSLMKSGKGIEIDEIAYKELADLVASARSQDVKIFAYFHPLPYELYLAQQESFADFQDKIKPLFTKQDRVWDFNSGQYLSFRRDYGNYIDHAHLSPKGARFILKEIVRHLNDDLGVFPGTDKKGTT